MSNPYAITMWDFSWLERQWSGAGYEDWDIALGELAERGYDAVRIDAYPHLVAAGAERMWTLKPQWNQSVWGAPDLVDVIVLPSLLEFIAKAERHGIKVGLSTWFREDIDNTRMSIYGPDELARVWIATLQHIRDAGLLHNILYVDLCNEFPVSVWSPFIYGTTIGRGHRLANPVTARWMNDTTALVRAAFPELEYTFSFAEDYKDWRDIDVSSLDFLEPHIWMAGISDFYTRVGYAYELFEPIGFTNVGSRAESVYRSDQARYDSELFAKIDLVAEWSRGTAKPVVTTECWSIVDYKDWPRLDWGWVKELNARGVEHALGTGRWVGVATSNFCGPQFVGMWRDVDYHRALTAQIHSAAIDIDLQK